MQGKARNARLTGGRYEGKGSRPERKDGGRPKLAKILD
jgi:hypothetical protein